MWGGVGAKDEGGGTKDLSWAFVVDKRLLYLSSEERDVTL